MSNRGGRNRLGRFHEELNARPSDAHARLFFIPRAVRSSCKGSVPEAADDDTPPAVGEAVRAARLEHGRSQEHLARSGRLSRRHIAAIESHSNFTVFVLLALLRELPPLEIGGVLAQAAMQQRLSIGNAPRARVLWPSRLKNSYRR